MPALYTLKVITDFASAHTLRNYPGACARMHGHNWKVELEVQARELDDLGIGLDFKEMKRVARQVCEELDHRYLNDIPPFDRINPTAENIAAHLFQRLSQELNTGRAKVHAVTVWETERACVRYTEEP
ncbi:MAG: 6-carboxytetrahydropterin synthase QueD [Gammaproteobacteria bacterium RBG_16_57_12]|nr:MAG: 6-carboxytetrahydropterin synthase QueD [Gammaproteobacteria bacterium RBG_16_57_12]